MRAEKNIPTIIPDNSSFVLLKNPPTCARNQTRNIVRKAPINPKTGIKTCIPSITARILPKAAPEDIPRIYGSARGLSRRYSQNIWFSKGVIQHHLERMPHSCQHKPGKKCQHQAWQTHRIDYINRWISKLQINNQ
jgi:hypothetical protein